MDSTSDIHPFAGVLVGAVLTFILTGMSFPELNYYFKTYTTDSSVLKTMVRGLCVLDFIHALMIAHLSVVITSEDVQSINSISSFQGIVGIVRIASIIAHIFLLSRVYLLSPDKSTMHPWVTGLLFLLHTAIYTATTSATYFDVAFQPFKGINILLVSKFSADAIVSGVLLAQLPEKPAGSVSNESICDIFLDSLVNPGILANLVGLTAIIIGIIVPGNLVSVALFIPLSKLHSISILAFLNSREPPSTVAADEEKERLLEYEAEIRVEETKA